MFVRLSDAEVACSGVCAFQAKHNISLWKWTQIVLRHVPFDGMTG